MTIAWSKDRLIPAAGVLALHAALFYALLTGLAGQLVTAAGDRMKVFDVAAPPPPPRIEEAPVPERSSAEAEGEAAPPNLRADPAPIAAPEPRIRIERPPPVTAAPVAASGTAPSAGAAEQPGPGTGAGGMGNGLGSGGSGNGAGGGGRGAGARLVSGRIVNADFPRTASNAGAQGSVTAHLTIGTDGRVINCRVAKSSGNADLDATTCRLIRERFRYTPARDASGNAVTDLVGWRQDWWFAPRD